MLMAEYLGSRQASAFSFMAKSQYLGIDIRFEIAYFCDIIGIMGQNCRPKRENICQKQQEREFLSYSHLARLPLSPLR